MATVIDHQAQLVEQRHAALAQFYNDTFAWPTTIDSTTGNVLLQLGTVVDALAMRTALAGEVSNFLVRHMFRPPIIAVPGDPGAWILLTRPRTTMRLSVWEELVRIQVRWKRRGDTILLPALDNVDKGVRWIEPPHPQQMLPPWTAVVAAARRVSSLYGSW